MPFIKISFTDIHFDPKVQNMCISSSFKCPFYGHSWSCPPNSPYLEKAFATYKEFFLIYSIFDLEEYIKKEKERTNRSEFFIKNTYLLTKGMERSDLEEEFTKFIENYNNTYKKKLFLYDGTCKVCKIQGKESCTYDSGEPCRFPDKMRYSMESVGIDVISTVRELKKKELIDIEYPSNKYSYRFGLACFK